MLHLTLNPRRLLATLALVCALALALSARMAPGVAAAAFAPAHTAHSAYTTEVPRWRGAPGPGQCCLDLYIYFDTTMESYDVNAFNAAINAWNFSAAQVNLFITTVNGVTTVNDRWNNCKDLRDGVTLQSWGGGFWTSATSEMNQCYSSVASAGQNQSVAAHELGHMIALAHNNTSSPCSAVALMFPSTDIRYGTCHINTPTNDDTAGVNSLY